ncbi:hypothetical protein DL766_003447 [Monosporascus sp. MC13-8B]|uniref:Prion-inhibition and propagation HeLo domain-containing protein n=1 Tax=Monosporascus cannonballus TaxID=155416 RepID=A0ABY0HKH6_9PEZI|nr:hypothetical protein DL763_006647 [Monosporascus cannonballus]RYO92727.1 hypothetical protein DL762_001433 [Monosporascus cannonballus]RYP33527.1 hypothetical protein DL766_003447 [Monosporascus sp. MC13-8B]
MAEVVGLTLSVLGIAGLFKACIDNFDIVVRAREFSQVFEYLCPKLALHRTRLVLWGETLGIAQAEEGGGPVHYIRSLEHPIIKPTVESCLSQLCDLLGKADIVSENYSLKDEDPREGSDSKGLAVLRDTFERIREGIHKNQKQKSVRKVTKWAVHDHAQFEELVHKIGALLDGLEKVLEALGRLEAYQSQLEREIETISDEDSLSRLEEVCSSVSASPALKAISDTASMRLTIITSSSKSYATAKSTQIDDTQETEGVSVPHNGVRRAELPALTLTSRPQLAQPNAQDAALVFALSSLLASPNLEDPLVPEIAEKYIMDYEGYCEDARRLTWRYARDGRPDEESIGFPTEHTGSKIQATPYVTPEPRPKSLARSEVHVDVENFIESEYEYERELLTKSKGRQESGSEDEQDRELRSLAETQSELEENRPRGGGVLLDGIPVDCKKDAVENWMRELGSGPKAMQPDPPCPSPELPVDARVDDSTQEP